MNLMDQYSQQSGKCVRSQALVGLTVGVLEPYVSFDGHWISLHWCKLYACMVNANTPSER